MKKRNIGCVIMASGQGRRFGSNKLLADFGGKSMLERILEATSGELFGVRVVVTRHPEVVRICEKYQVPTVLHDLPYRNDTVRLGIENILKYAEGQVNGCMFCPADQPLLRKASLERLSDALEDEDEICRLSYEEKVGAPILFGKRYFEELTKLPQGKGGVFLVQKYPDKVKCVMAKEEEELMDVDTPEALMQLLEK